ncbi:hypothetical protein [Hymenobacter sp. PAMC 26628]|uniref:hypothetical protein n=1 Tax=Hymenobacter sp. PAMC 26628 TaxID=1484118 RepID=UPI00076FF562|nr:hypothetical protein [Hymenobacter sp. PAMC 26628]AMJ65178.1 hypothetical protein AXW84_06875 [Hymenobacter sp. PAMC 26628]
MTPRTAPATAALPLETDFLRLAYRPDVHQLVARWRQQGPVAELRRGYRALLAAAEAAACPYWVVDVRSRDALDAAATRWLTDTFLPLLPARLASPVYLAYLVSPRHLAVLGAAAATAGAEARVAFFAEEGPLNQWLVQRQSGAARGTKS